MFSYKFYGVADGGDIKLVIDFLSKQDLNYPHYQDWVQRTESELCSEYKQAILAMAEGRLVGNLVYQWHKSMARTIELKNLRLDPAVVGRGFANFMLKQVEAEYKDIPIICDLRSTQVAMIQVLLQRGYIPTARLSLYDTNHEDLVMVKMGDACRKSLMAPTSL